MKLRLGITFGFLTAISFLHVGGWYASHRERLQHLEALNRELCYMKHARNLAVMGDNFVRGQLLYPDFVHIWRDERERFNRECADRPT